MNGYRVRIDAFLPSGPSVEGLVQQAAIMRETVIAMHEQGYLDIEVRPVPGRRRKPDDNRAKVNEAAPQPEHAEALAAIKQVVQPDTPEMPEHLRRTRQTAAE